MATFEIPLSSRAQRFSISLAGVSYTFVVRWSTPSNNWILDIYDVNDVLLLASLPFVTGANLLEQFEYLQFGFELWVQSDGDKEAVPTYANLGTESHLYAVVP